MIATYRELTPLVRILVSETDEWLAEIIAELVHEMARAGISVATVLPPSIREDDLLETAAKQKFDAAVLLMNNIFYEPYDLLPHAEKMRSNSLRLIGKFVKLFGKPVVALYGWPDCEAYQVQLLDAGATGAVKIPCAPDDLQQELKHCLPIW